MISYPSHVHIFKQTHYTHTHNTCRKITPFVDFKGKFCGSLSVYFKLTTCSKSSMNGTHCVWFTVRCHSRKRTFNSEPWVLNWFLCQAHHISMLRIQFESILIFKANTRIFVFAFTVTVAIWRMRITYLIIKTIVDHQHDATSNARQCSFSQATAPCLQLNSVSLSLSLPLL